MCIWLDQAHQRRPRNHTIHLFEKDRLARLLQQRLEARRILFYRPIIPGLQASRYIKLGRRFCRPSLGSGTTTDRYELSIETVEGTSYGFGHLTPMATSVVLPVSGQMNVTVPIQVSFGCHCFTEEFKDALHQDTTGTSTRGSCGPST